MASWLRLLQAVAAASSTASTTRRRVAFLPEKHVDFIFSVKPEPSIFWICVILALFVIGITLYYIRIRRRQARDTIS
jgi:cell division protein FtsW (lipid II flippase)